MIRPLTTHVPKDVHEAAAAAAAAAAARAPYSKTNDENSSRGEKVYTDPPRRPPATHRQKFPQISIDS